MSNKETVIPIKFPEPIITEPNSMIDNRVYIQDEINEDFSWQVITPFFEYLTNHSDPKLNKKNKEEIHIFLNSPGGLASGCSSLLYGIKQAKATNIKIVTHVIGNVASAASCIAIVGDVRYMKEESIHMIHYGSLWLYHTNIDELDNASGVTKQYFNQIKTFYLKYSKIDKKEVDKLLRDRAHYFTSKECLKLGLCDKIIGM